MGIIRIGNHQNDTNNSELVDGTIKFTKKNLPPVDCSDRTV